MLAKWRCSIDLISARSVLAEDSGDVAGVAERRRLGVDRVAVLCGRRPPERRDAERLGAVCLMIVVTVLGCAAAAAAGVTGWAGSSEPETSMMTATPAPSSSTAISAASVMISPRWLFCGGCGAGTRGGPLTSGP